MNYLSFFSFDQERGEKETIFYFLVHFLFDIFFHLQFFVSLLGFQPVIVYFKTI